MSDTLDDDMIARWPMSARETAVGALDMVLQLGWWEVGMKPMRNLALLLAGADERRDGMKRDSPRRKPVNVDGLVEKWADVLVGLSTAHDHAARTAADHQTDELLGPLLTAPIAQIREFGQKLANRLEADERVPFLVWSSFRRVIEPLVLKGPDGELLRLKKELAGQIAELAEKGLDRGQLIAAIAGALQWRGEASLKAVKTSLESGSKPRITGRESCLFLEAGDAVVVL
jgi:hypothetical protein